MCKVWILEFGDFGFWIVGILDFGFWGFWILGILDFGLWILGILDFRDFGDFGFWIFGTLCSKSLCAKFGFWNLGILDFGDFGFWILDFGDLGFWILDWGFWMGTLWQNFGCYIRKETVHADPGRRICSYLPFVISTFRRGEAENSWRVGKVEDGLVASWVFMQ